MGPDAMILIFWMLSFKPTFSSILNRRVTSLVVQWLRPHASSVVGAGSIPGGGIKIPHAVLCGENK